MQPGFTKFYNPNSPDLQWYGVVVGEWTRKVCIMWSTRKTHTQLVFRFCSSPSEQPPNGAQTTPERPPDETVRPSRSAGQAAVTEDAEARNARPPPSRFGSRTGASRVVGRGGRRHRKQCRAVARVQSCARHRPGGIPALAPGAAGGLTEQGTKESAGL